MTGTDYLTAADSHSWTVVAAPQWVSALRNRSDEHSAVTLEGLSGPIAMPADETFLLPIIVDSASLPESGGAGHRGVITMRFDLEGSPLSVASLCIKKWPPHDDRNASPTNHMMHC